MQVFCRWIFGIILRKILGQGFWLLHGQGRREVVFGSGGFDKKGLCAYCPVAVNRGSSLNFICGALSSREGGEEEDPGFMGCRREE